MPLREEKTFTDDEVTAAWSFILPADEARAQAVDMNSMPDFKGFETATPEELEACPVKGPLSYDGDFLDLMSLVSGSCAARAWVLLGISAAEGARRREAFRRRIRPILRTGHLPPHEL